MRLHKIRNYERVEDENLCDQPDLLGIMTKIMINFDMPNHQTVVKKAKAKIQIGKMYHHQRTSDFCFQLLGLTTLSVHWIFQQVKNI